VVSQNLFGICYYFHLCLGYLYFSPLVQRLPDDLRRKAARQLAGKCALCSRVDACHSASDGSVGRRYAAEVANKFEKWLEPPPTKSVRPVNSCGSNCIFYFRQKPCRNRLTNRRKNVVVGALARRKNGSV
jgi:RNA processing factor Prp31